MYVYVFIYIYTVYTYMYNYKLFQIITSISMRDYTYVIICVYVKLE